MNSPLLAWSVEYEEIKAVLYAANEEDVFETWKTTRDGLRACTLDGKCFEPIIIRRETQFDEYAAVHVPLEAYLEAGWPMECESCFRPSPWVHSVPRISDPHDWIIRNGEATCLACYEGEYPDEDEEEEDE